MPSTQWAVATFSMHPTTWMTFTLTTECACPIALVSVLAGLAIWIENPNLKRACKKRFVFRWIQTVFSQKLRRGIKLSRKGEGDIWLTVLNGPIFVQSSFLDDLTSRKVRDWPHEFKTGVVVKVIFENDWILKLFYRFSTCTNFTIAFAVGPTSRHKLPTNRTMSSRHKKWQVETLRWIRRCWTPKRLQLDR